MANEDVATEEAHRPAEPPAPAAGGLDEWQLQAGNYGKFVCWTLAGAAGLSSAEDRWLLAVGLLALSAGFSAVIDYGRSEAGRRLRRIADGFLALLSVALAVLVPVRVFGDWFARPGSVEWWRYAVAWGSFFGVLLTYQLVRLSVLDPRAAARAVREVAGAVGITAVVGLVIGVIGGGLYGLAQLSLTTLLVIVIVLLVLRR